MADQPDNSSSPRRSPDSGADGRSSGRDSRSDGESSGLPPLPGPESRDGPSAEHDAFRSLLLRAQSILATCGWNGERYTAFRPGGIEVLKLRSESMELIRRIFGESSPFTERMAAFLDEPNPVRHGYHVKPIADLLAQAYGRFSRDEVFRLADQIDIAFEASRPEHIEAMLNAGALPLAAHHAGKLLREELHRRAARDLPQTEGELDPRVAIDALLGLGRLDQATHRRLAAVLQVTADALSPRGRAIHEDELRDSARFILDWLSPGKTDERARRGA